MNMGIISRVVFFASPPPPTTTLSSSIQQSKTLKRTNFTHPCHTPSLSISTRLPQRSRGCCRSSTGPGAPGSGDGESRSVLDAFFLGKALAEALNERIESTVGEILSTVGRLQAEQQKQVQDFQNEVLERAKKAKEKSAREAMEAQGLVVPNKSRSAINTTSSSNAESSSSSSEAGTDPAVK